MKRVKINPLLKAAGTIGAVAALVSGVTFAALQSQATLTDNTIASATANLQISSDPGCATDTGHTTFGATKPGFDFKGIVPGTTPSQTETFCLWNSDTEENTAASLALNVGMPADATWTPAASVNNNLVTINIDCGSGRTVSDSAHNVWFLSDNFAGAALAPDETAVCTINVSMATNAFTGSGVVSDAFNLVFTGTGV